MRKVFNYLITAVIVTIVLFVFCACAKSDIGASYKSDDGVMYTIEEVYWSKHQMSQNDGPWIDVWRFAILIKVKNTTSRILTPKTEDFMVYYQEQNQNVTLKFAVMATLDPSTHVWTNIYSIAPGQTAYITLYGADIYENPTLKYSENFYLVHEVKNELGVERKTFNLGVVLNEK